MKTYRVQFNECIKNGTCQLMNLDNKEIIKFRPNIKGIESMERKQVYFCNKYMKRCSSKVCIKKRMNERMIIKN